MTCDDDKPLVCFQKEYVEVDEVLDLCAKILHRLSLSNEGSGADVVLGQDVVLFSSD
jgi:hypothetical protein